MRKVSLLLSLFLSIALVVFFTAAAHASTLEVGEGKLFTSIQDAITDAVTGDIVLVYDGTYVEQINFMGKAITVKSVNGAASTIIDGNAGGTVVTLINGEGLGSVLDGFTITNGNNGGIYCYSSSLTITNSIITGNSANSGGGVYCNNCALTITNSTISENTANSGGGVYYVYTSSSTITSSTIAGNSADSGGGISFAYSSPTITNSTITGNSAGSSGGGIYCVYYSSPTITNSTITENTVVSNDMESYGGGIYIALYSSPTITNCTVSGNRTTSYGRSCYGGGIYCIAYSSPTITNSTITGNSAISYAGSLFGSYAGGICSQNDSSPTITNSILWGNIALTAYNEIAQISSTITCTYSNIDQDGYAGSDGNIRQDPLFVDQGNGDFHLQQGSPCIDAGTSDGAPSTDMKGFPRYDEPLAPNTGGGTYPYYDMGAYESQMLVVSPIDGTIGTVITINGSGFGDRKGKVLINGIPAKIAKEDWSPTRIICTIKKPPFPAEVAHPVSVVANRVPTLLDGTFTQRGLVLDELLTSSGAYPDPIKITGTFFGTKKGRVYLFDAITEKKKRLKVSDWKMNETTGVSELTFVVPKPSRSFPAGSYQLRVENKIGPASTSPDFELLEPVL